MRPKLTRYKTTSIISILCSPFYTIQSPLLLSLSILANVFSFLLSAIEHFQHITITAHSSDRQLNFRVSHFQLGANYTPSALQAANSFSLSSLGKSSWGKLDFTLVAIYGLATVTGINLAGHSERPN